MRKYLLLFFCIVTIGAASWVVVNQEFVRDYYIVKTTDLQSEAATLMSSLNLTKDASFIYRASRPEVQTSDEFNKSCANVHKEHSIVLGCYTNKRFFIFDVNDERLSGVKEVTAAHELLHAVYERLSPKERALLDPLLRRTALTVEDQRFQETLALYQKTSPDQITNELHSILGTEIMDLPDELEEHYRRYFSNRQQIVEYTKAYVNTLTEIETKIEQYDQQLQTLKDVKDSLEQNLVILGQQIESEREQLDRMIERGEVDQYNNLVPRFNALVRRYNSDVAKVQNIVSDHNSLLEMRNSLTIVQNDLIQKLDSNVKTLQ